MSTHLPGSEVQLIGPLLPNGASTIEASRTDEADWKHIFQELDKIRALTADWDGQGAEAPKGENVDWAAEWVRQMRRYPSAIPPTHAVPGIAGEVYLEWRYDPLYLVAEICAPAQVEWTLSHPGQPNRHWVTEGGLPYFLSAAN
jgi:hypothetical protein